MFLNKMNCGPYGRHLSLSFKLPLSLRMLLIFVREFIPCSEFIHWTVEGSTGPRENQQRSPKATSAQLFPTSQSRLRGRPVTYVSSIRVTPRSSTGSTGKEAEGSEAPKLEQLQQQEMKSNGERWREVDSDGVLVMPSVPLRLTALPFSFNSH